METSSYLYNKILYHHGMENNRGAKYGSTEKNNCKLFIYKMSTRLTNMLV